jgi:hypothetical protein
MEKVIVLFEPPPSYQDKAHRVWQRGAASTSRPILYGLHKYYHGFRKSRRNSEVSR